MPSYQHPLDFVKETAGRFKSNVPAYWRRLQILAGSVAVMAGFILKFEAHLVAEWVPYLKHALSGGLLIAGTAQLTCKDKEPSPTATLETRLAAVLPDTPPPESGLEAHQEEESA